MDKIECKGNRLSGRRTIDRHRWPRRNRGPLRTVSIREMRIVAGPSWLPAQDIFPEGCAECPCRPAPGWPQTTRVGRWLRVERTVAGSPPVAFARGSATLVASTCAACGTPPRRCECPCPGPAFRAQPATPSTTRAGPPNLAAATRPPEDERPAMPQLFAAAVLQAMRQTSVSDCLRRDLVTQVARWVR